MSLMFPVSRAFGAFGVAELTQNVSSAGSGQMKLKDNEEEDGEKG